jgi:hypothetical protein
MSPALSPVVSTMPISMPQSILKHSVNYQKPIMENNNSIEGSGSNSSDGDEMKRDVTVST